MDHIGVLAYGSLIKCPGWELDETTDRRIEDVLTPFSIEFARISDGRGGAPTLVPVAEAGSQVKATVLVMKQGTTLPAARNMTYRRERDKVGQMEVTYTHSDTPPGENYVHLPIHPDGLAGVDEVIYTVLGDTISPAYRTGTHLADLAIKSIAIAGPGRDGISYLLDAISMGIRTPLTDEYRDEVLRLTSTATLDEAIAAVRGA